MGSLQQSGMFPLFIFYYSSFLRAVLTRSIVRAAVEVGSCCPFPGCLYFLYHKPLCRNQKHTGRSDLPWLTSAVAFTVINIHVHTCPCISPSRPAVPLPPPAPLPPASSAGAGRHLGTCAATLPPVWSAFCTLVLRERVRSLYWRSLSQAGAEQFQSASSCIINKKGVLTNNLQKKIAL